jgi:hypothetical protein
MTKIITTILITFLSTFCVAQNKDVEILINQVYQQIAPSSFEYYYLIDSSFRTGFDEYSLDKEELKDLLKNNPDFPYDNFILKSKNAVLLSWRNYNLEKARICSYADAPMFFSQIRLNRLVPFNTSKQVLDSMEKQKKHFELIVPVKTSWSDKRINKEIDKAWIKYFNSKKPEERLYFRFSTPIFSDNGLWAIVTLNQSDRGATHIFKKVEGKWIDVLLFGRWIS